MKRRLSKWQTTLPGNKGTRLHGKRCHGSPIDVSMEILDYSKHSIYQDRSAKIAPGQTIGLAAVEIGEEFNG